METVTVNEIVFLFQDGRIFKKGQPSKQHYINQVFIVRGARHKTERPLTASWEFAKCLLKDSKITQKKILSSHELKTLLFSWNSQLWNAEKPNNEYLFYINILIYKWLG